LDSVDFEAFGAAGFFVAAGAATDFPFGFAMLFEVFLGETMYLPWKSKSVANRRKHLGASTWTIAVDEHRCGDADIETRENAANGR
jgi:hypothetical protein